MIYFWYSVCQYAAYGHALAMGQGYDEHALTSLLAAYTLPPVPAPAPIQVVAEMDADQIYANKPLLKKVMLKQFVDAMTALSEEFVNRPGNIVHGDAVNSLIAKMKAVKCKLCAFPGHRRGSCWLNHEMSKQSKGSTDLELAYVAWQSYWANKSKVEKARLRAKADKDKEDERQEANLEREKAIVEAKAIRDTAQAKRDQKAEEKTRDKLEKSRARIKAKNQESD